MDGEKGKPVVLHIDACDLRLLLRFEDQNARTKRGLCDSSGCIGIRKWGKERLPKYRKEAVRSDKPRV